MKPNFTRLFILCLCGFSNPNYAQSYNELQNQFPQNLKEDVSKRDMNSKHFFKENGQMEAYLSPSPIHYLDAHKNWTDINTSIIKSSGEIAGFNEENSLKSYFPAHLGEAAGVRFVGDEGQIIVGLQPSLKVISESGDILSIIENAGSATPAFSKNSVSYQNAFSDADIQFIVESGSVKNNLILNSLPANIPENTAYLSYSEIIQIEENWTIEVDWINGTSLTSKAIKILDRKGEAQFTIPVPDIYEKFNESKSIHSDGLWDVAYKVENIGNGQFELSTLIPMTWLLDNERTFPVVVDPTVTLYGTYGGWLNSSSSINDDGFYVYTLNTGSSEYRAWTRFNLSSIPNDALIQNSEINMYLNGAGDANSHTIYVNDVTSGQYGNYGSFNSTAYTDLGNGNYTTFNVTGTTSSYYGWTDLGTTADADIESSLYSDNFQLGFSKSSNASDTYRRFTASSNQLRITYINCTGQLAGTISASALNRAC